MCGIVGAIGTPDSGVARRMLAALNHRGPDQNGLFSTGAIHVGASRLSIVEPASSVQPMIDGPHRRCLVFNGEIYNYLPLRQRLQKLGHVFRSRGDTEVLLRAFEEWGPACIEHLEGMYAFLVVDGQDVYFARDGLGIKPLYWARLERAGVFLLASEIKALFASQLVEPMVRQQALVDQVALGFLAGAHTFFEGIQTVPVGQVQRIQSTSNGVMPAELAFRREPIRCSPQNLSFDDAVDQLDVHLGSAVRSHLQADAPPGLTLSGGIDSTLLAHYMAREGAGQIHCFTIGDSLSHPDVVAARRVTMAMGGSATVTIPTVEDALEAFPHCIVADEQPCSLHTHTLFLLFRNVAASHKACLNGEGADELFGGYAEYGGIDAWKRHISARLQLVAAAGMTPSADVQRIVDRVSRDAGSPDAYLATIFDVNLADQLTRKHLEVIDKYSMASSVEVRVPYLAESVVRFANSLPMEFKVDRRSRARKRILHALAGRVLPKPVLSAVVSGKIGLPAAGRQTVATLATVFENVAGQYRDRHPLKHILKSTHELLSYDLFEEIFLRCHGKVESNFSAVDFFAMKLDIATAALRRRIGEAAVPSIGSAA